MTITVNVHEAKTHFSKLLARVGLGEEVIIAKAGKPVARLIPFAEKARPRTAGSASGKLVVMPNFDASLLESVLASFEQ